MLCQKCKTNEANTYVKKIINGNMTEYHLCSECAKKLGYDNMISTTLPDFGEILGGLFSSPFTSSLANPTRCSLCGSSLNDIINSGKTGCANCYSVFGRELMPSIKKIHGNTIHCGKRLSNNGTNKEVSADELKAELKKAISMQEFEKAAELRDRIKELESSTNQGGQDNEKQ